MAAWIIGGGVFAGCWLAFFVAASLVDEDVNHWDWTGSGPGARTKMRMGALTGLAALVPAGAIWAFVRLLA